ncbi:MAG: hypothetical protein Q8Q09_11450 [Deltaproteobacteria bacterium]|nr:hypothetical protein [Deltaproteobacteria bacterium]
MSLAQERQRALQRFVTDSAFETDVRADPLAAAAAYAVHPEITQTLAQISPARVLAFQRSQRHKDSVRAGKRPSRIAR